MDSSALAIATTTADLGQALQLQVHDACAGFPAVHERHVVIAQLPVKQGSILSLACRVDALGQWHKALLQAPAQQHLWAQHSLKSVPALRGGMQAPL